MKRVKDCLKDFKRRQYLVLNKNIENFLELSPKIQFISTALFIQTYYNTEKMVIQSYTHNQYIYKQQIY